MAQKLPTSDAEVPPFRTRLEVAFASAAPKAVILRRGPKRHFNLINWDLEADTFESGQWMKGIVRLCDLSPSGNHLIYWAAQYHASAPDFDRGPHRSSDAHRVYDPLAAKYLPDATKKYKRRKVPAYLRPESLYGKRGQKDNRRRWGRHPPRANGGVWTAISRPPYFSALAIWPCFGHWTGGGMFRGEDDIVLFESDDGITPVENVPIPARIRVQTYEAARTLGTLPKALTEKPERDEVRVALLASLETSLHKSGVRWIDWTYVQPGGDLLFAADGCVFRLANWDRIAEGDHLAKADLLADFTQLRFRMMRPPAEALRWL